MDNEQIVRNVYKIAEQKDSVAWVAAFTPDGTFTDESIGVTYRGRDLYAPVENYGRAFSDMHRELYRVYVDGDVVIVQTGLLGHLISGERVGEASGGGVGVAEVGQE